MLRFKTRKEVAPAPEGDDGDRRGSSVDPFGHAWLLASRREAVSYEDMKARFEKLMQAGGDD